ncbi:MAG: hypothetical protein HDP34_05145 [Clostridia bacterium]|nr:hypothetical protein [Clostridia bacterium]
MKALKVKICLIAALCIALTATLLASVILFVKADRSVTVSGSSIFTTAGSSEVWAHKDGTADDSPAYSMFVFKKDDDAVNYKKNLAFKWYENGAVWEDKEKAPTTLTPTDGYFNMEIGFEELSFEKFIITIESQQYYETKDGKTTNYIYFVPAENDNVYVYVALKATDDKDAEEAYKHAGESIATVAKDHIKIYVTGISNGNCLLKINDTEKGGQLENFGGNYAKYSSSSTTPVTPLSFKAKFAEKEGEEENAYARMAIYNLNGQSFVLTGATETDGHLSGGTVNDVTPPVLCLDKGVSFIEDGEEITFNYTVIDVLASSPNTTTAYYMLSKAQQEQGAEFNATDCSDEGPFRVVKSDEEQRMIPHVNHYVPKTDDYKTAGTFSEDFVVTAAVKVYLKLTDTTSTGGQSTYVLLDWYVEDKYLLDINGTSYIAVAKDEVGATFKENEINNSTLKTDYQQAVDAAAEKQELKAGSKNSFYLPSVDSLLSDNATNYSDLTFNIFYMTDGSGSFQSLTGKAANALSISLSKAGRYVFTIVATDTSGNKMYYLKPGEAGKDPEKVEISTSTSDILSMYEQKKGTDYEDTKKYLPWFEFEVASSTIEITDPGEQDTAYVGTTYSSISFEVNGVSYDTAYRLYLFRNDLYYAANGVSLTYDEFMAQKEELITSHREWFTYIYATNKMNEGDEEYEEFKDYAWDDSSLSFVPQDSNAFYLIECTATSTENGKQADKAYMGISASPKVRDLKGEDTWLQDNMTSVILLCIAGVSLIGIVLLLVIKPKNKGDLDEEFETTSKK